jgi:hypothetical protein
MSDVSQYEDDGEVSPGEFDYTQAVRDVQSAGPDIAAANIAENPEHGVRAMQLAEATGLPPQAVYNDPEFDNVIKLRTAGNIIRNNGYINQYLQGSPMASVVSNDDYGNLDQFSQSAVQTMGKYNPFAIFAKAQIEAGGAAIEGIREGWGDLLPKRWSGNEWVDNKVLSGPAGPIYATLYGLGQVGLKTLGAAAKGAEQGLGKMGESLYEQTIGDSLPTSIDPYGAKGFGKALSGIVEMELNQPPIAMGISPAGVRDFQLANLAKTIESPEMAAAIKARPFLENGIEPPSGLHPMIDKAKAETNVDMLTSLEKDLQLAVQSATRERSPELFQQFAEKHYGNSTIAISGDRVAELYRDRIPEPNDGLLGWVDGIGDKLEAAKALGEDVHIRTSDWVSRVDPALAKTLNEDIRMWPGGVTAKEAKELATEPRPVVDSPLAQIRDIADLEPMFANGDRKLELRKQEEKFSDFQDELIMHDAQGNPVGYIIVEPRPGTKQLYIDMVQGTDVNGFGPSAIRDIKRQLKELYPEYETVTGHRVSGARDQAGSWQGPSAHPEVKLDAPNGWGEVPGGTDTFAGFERILKDAWREQVHPDVEVNIKPRELFTKNEEALAKIVDEELAILTGGKIKPEFTQEIRAKNAANPTGVHIGYRDRLPRIFVDLFGPDAVGVARHESIHYLRQSGFITPHEWAALTKAAREEGWIQRYDIDARYQKGSEFLKLEESIAEAFRDWAKNKEANVGVATPVTGVFARMAELWEKVKARFAEILGKEPTFNDLFEAVYSGEVGKRTEGKPIHEGAFDPRMAVTDFEKGRLEWAEKNKIELTTEDMVNAMKTRVSQIESDLRGVSKDDVRADRNELTELRARLRELQNEQQPMFSEGEAPKKGPKPPEPEVAERMEALKANATGLDVKTYRKLQEQIQARFKEDLEAAQARAEKIEKKTLTQEWRDNLKETRAEVEATLKQRPDIAADLFLGSGELHGTKIRQRYSLDAADLTPEQIAMLPERYVSKSGLPADATAQLFGFPNKESMIEALAKYNEAKGEKTGSDFLKDQVNEESARLMQQRYGNLDDNIMTSAADRAFSETNLNLIAEELQAAAMQAGVKVIDKDVARVEATRIFENMRMSEIDSNKLMANVGKHGRDAERALINGDQAGALVSLQKKYLTSLITRMAIDLEKAKVSLDKIAQPYQRRETKGPDQEFVPYIQALLNQAGYKTRLSPEQIARGLEFHGQGSLEKFVDRVYRGDKYELKVSEDLMQNGAKPIDQMTALEFNEFQEAITSLNWVARKSARVEIEGAAKDFADYRGQVIENIEQLPVRTREDQVEGKGKWLYKYDGWLTRTEEVIKDLDLRQELGPLWSGVMHQMETSKTKFNEMATELAEYFRKVEGKFDKKWRKTLDDTIENNIIWDPHNKSMYDMTRENLIQVMLNWGTNSNINKFAGGVFFARYRRRPTKDELPMMAAQIKALIDRNATKQDWEFVQAMLEPFKKWQPEMDRVARNTTGIAPKLIEAQEIITPHGTFSGGYWPVKYDKLASNMDAIKDRASGSTFMDEKYFRAATAKSYLKDRTGYVDFVDISRSLEQAAGVMQQTMHDIAYREAIGQSAKILFDPAIKSAIKRHYGVEYADQMEPWLKRISYQYAMDDVAASAINSFLRRMRINLVQHTLPFNYKVILSPDMGVPNPVTWAKFASDYKNNMKFVMENSNEVKHLVYNLDRDYSDAMAKVVSNSAYDQVKRKAIEWGYAIPVKMSQQFRAATFWNEFQKAKGAGKETGDAIKIADSYVREQHGTASIADASAMMNPNSEAMKMLTVFQGYFNMQYNWQRQIPGHIRRGDYGRAVEAFAGTYGVNVALGALLFNQAKEDDSLLKIWSKSIAMTPFQMIPVGNSAASYFVEGFNPRVPFASLFTAAQSAMADAKKAYQGKKVEKPITHMANLMGLSSGMPLGQAGRTGQFLYDAHVRGTQRPRNVIEYIRGLETGEARLKK